MQLSDKKPPVENGVPDTIMTKVSSFPSMPKAVAKLRDLFKKGDVPIKEIEKILRQDPGLSANVLRLANSARFGVSSKVRSLNQAVMLLGLKRFEQIAIGACMNKIMDKAVEGYNLSPGELWLHSIAVSTTAEAMAKFLKISNASDVFTPALLHDMGKLILGKFVKNDSAQIQSLVANGESLASAEYMVLGTDHAEIGSLILKRWSFPADIVDAVRWHHDPDYLSETRRRLKEPSVQSDIVYLSNLIFESQGDGDSGDEQFLVPSPEVLKRLGIKLEEYRAIAKKADSWKKKLSDTLCFE
jgi:putative nucleotidyltransferase with HDIG domain